MGTSGTPAVFQTVKVTDLELLASQRYCLHVIFHPFLEVILLCFN